MIQLNTKESLKKKAWTNVLHDVHENFWSDVHYNVRYNVQYNVRNNVEDNVWDNICKHLTNHTEQI
jgi:hypothetical protein